MEIATKKVDSQRCGELQPGVLRVHSDGKRLHAEGFKADLSGNARYLRGICRHGPRDQREPAAPLERAAKCLQRPTAVPQALLPVTVRAPSRASSPPLSVSRTSAVLECIEIEFHSARIRLHGHVDAQRLGVVLDVLAQRT